MHLNPYRTPGWWWKLSAISSGAMRSHLSDFKKYRAARIDHYVVEVNKLIIRLEKVNLVLFNIPAFWTFPRFKKKIHILVQSVPIYLAVRFIKGTELWLSSHVTVFLFYSWVLCLVWPCTVDTISVSMYCFQGEDAISMCFKNHLFSCIFSPSFTLLNFSLMFLSWFFQLLILQNLPVIYSHFGSDAVMLDAVKIMSKMAWFVQVWQSLFSTTCMNMALEINRKVAGIWCKTGWDSYLLKMPGFFFLLCWVLLFSFFLAKVQFSWMYCLTSSLHRLTEQTPSQLK